MSSPPSSLTPPPPPHLPYDLLSHILSLLAPSPSALARCALANWEMNHAASRVLYARVVLKPRRETGFRLGVRGYDVPKESNLSSAMQSRNAGFVVVLEVGGYLPQRLAQSTALRTLLLSALRLFTNLHSVHFFPAACHEGLLAGIGATLATLPLLRELGLNGFCTAGEENARALGEVRGLERLTLGDPGRAVLEVLPGWLGVLGGLEELHLKGNCGSITPGVLRSFLPHVKPRLRAFSLGLSYSLTDEDVFTFLGELPLLERVELRYYWQFKTPPRQPALPKLKVFAVNYECTEFKTNVQQLCKWIRRAIERSPIETVRVVPVQFFGLDVLSAPSFGSLVDHLTKKHWRTLRVLDLRKCYVDLGALRAMFGACRGLEEFWVRAREAALEDFVRHAEGMGRLHSAGFDIQNVKHRWRVGAERVGEVMRAGAVLRRLVVNGVHWEGSWTMGEGGEMAFGVREVHGRREDETE